MLRLYGKSKALIYAILAVILYSHFFVNREEIAMADTRYIQLPAPVTKGNVSVEEAILKRRSRRSFSEKELTFGQISQLLWAAQGITEERLSGGLRSAPSAGALYPMEIYLLSKSGLFHYIPQGNKLEVLIEKDLRKALAEYAFGQSAIGKANVVIVICAFYGRVTSKYGQRGVRYVDMEAGHIAQNIHLQAVALGLGSVPIGAFNDKGVKKTLLLSADCEPLYIIPVGYSD